MNAILLVVTIILDLVLVALAMVGAYHIRFYWGWIPLVAGIPPLASYLRVIPLILAVWALTYRYSELYSNWGRRRGIDEFFSIVGAAVLSVLVVLALAFFYRGFSYSRIVLVIFGFLLLVFISVNRLLMFGITRLLWRRGNGSGAGQEAGRWGRSRL